ncbi:BCL2 interacting protein 4 [Syngnathus typhle]
MSIPNDASSLEESLQGTWVESHFSAAASQSNSHHGSQELVMPTSTQQDDVENMLLDAQRESGRSSSGGSSQCNSPRRALTPLVWRGSGGSSLQSEEDLQERRQEVEVMMKKNADWIWDWCSRPENNPPKEFLLKHPKRSTPLSMRNSSVMKKGGVLSPDFLQLFLPSLIISHILAIGLGIYIGKRLASHHTL